MKLSTRSRYGTRLMFELALNYGKGTLFLKDISQRQKISEKYLSNLIIQLKSSGLVNSVRGAYGGYSLAKAPKFITLGEIVAVLEGEITIADPLEGEETDAALVQPITGIWENLEKGIFDYLNSITLNDVVQDYYEHQQKDTPMYFI